MDQFDKFYDYLQELDQSYTRLADLLRQKLTAVSSFQLVKLEEIMKEEQVYVLLAKGFDANLQTHREKLGLKGDTLGEIIDELPADRQGAFKTQYSRLKATLDEVKALNQKCQSTIEDRLHELDRSIKALDKSENATYQKSGDTKSGPPQNPGLFTKTI